MKRALIWFISIWCGVDTFSNGCCSESALRAKYGSVPWSKNLEIQFTKDISIIVDDILLFGSNEAEHDQLLEPFLN